MVAPEGLEPSRPKTRDFKSRASTSSATGPAAYQTRDTYIKALATPSGSEQVSGGAGWKQLEPRVGFLPYETIGKSHDVTSRSGPYSGQKRFGKSGPGVFLFVVDKGRSAKPFFIRFHAEPDSRRLGD